MAWPRVSTWTVQYFGQDERVGIFPTPGSQKMRVCLKIGSPTYSTDSTRFSSYSLSELLFLGLYHAIPYFQTHGNAFSDELLAIGGALAVVQGGLRAESAGCREGAQHHGWCAPGLGNCPQYWDNRHVEHQPNSWDDLLVPLNLCRICMTTIYEILPDGMACTNFDPFRSVQKPPIAANPLQKKTGKTGMREVRVMFAEHAWSIFLRFYFFSGWFLIASVGPTLRPLVPTCWNFVRPETWYNKKNGVKKMGRWLGFCKECRVWYVWSDPCLWFFRAFP